MSAGKNIVITPILSRDKETGTRVFANCMTCGHTLVWGSKNDNEAYKKCPSICPFCHQRLKPGVTDL